MALEVTGKLIQINDVQEISSTFRKREFVIEITETNMNSGMTFTNFASFQLVQDRVDAISPFQVGDNIKVSFNIRGNRWEKDGNVRYITNLNAWRIEKVGEMGLPAQEPGSGMPAANPQTPPSGSSTPQNTGTPPVSTEGGDDLPF